MHESEVSFGQACRVFWAFGWRFILIAAVLGAFGYGALSVTSLGSKPASSNAAVASLVNPTIFKGPVAPTLALVLLFIAGAMAMRMVLGMEFGDFQLAIRLERRDQPSSAKRALHSNPLSRNPQTESMRTKQIIYRR